MGGSPSAPQSFVSVGKLHGGRPKLSSLGERERERLYSEGEGDWSSDETYVRSCLPGLEAGADLCDTHLSYKSSFLARVFVPKSAGIPSTRNQWGCIELFVNNLCLQNAMVSPEVRHTLNPQRRDPRGFDLV